MSDDIEQLVAEASEIVGQWDRKGSWTADSPVGVLARLGEALEREHQRAEALSREAAIDSLGQFDDLMSERDAAVQRAERAEAAIREALSSDETYGYLRPETFDILSSALDTENGDAS